MLIAKLHFEFFKAETLRREEEKKSEKRSQAMLAMP